MDLDELEKLARAATPGPWRHVGRGTVMTSTHTDAERLPGGTPREAQLACVTGQAAMYGDPCRDVAELRDASATYIAAASPDVTLALIARVRAVEASKWQPIETAPEGPAVLAWLATHEAVICATYQGGVWRSMLGVPVTVTHWQPLPEPPKDGAS